MKKYLDSNGNELQFGELVSYNSENKDKHGTTTIGVNMTLNEETLPFLLALGAVVIVNEERDLSYYEDKLKNILEYDHMNILKEVFPKQFLSLIITLIHGDLETEEVKPGDHCWLFDYTLGKFIVNFIPEKEDRAYWTLTPFKSKKNANECMKIITPLIKQMYN